MATEVETIRKAEELLEELELLRRSMLTMPLPQFVKPWPTIKLLEKIHDSSKTAKIFAGHVDKAFQEAGIKLEEDETFACMLCVVKKPKYVSEVTGLSSEFIVEGPTPEPSAPDPTPEPGQITRGMVRKMGLDAPTEQDFHFRKIHAKAWRSIRYNIVMEPAIMEKVTKRKEDDRIHY